MSLWLLILEDENHPLGRMISKFIKLIVMRLRSGGI